MPNATFDIPCSAPSVLANTVLTHARVQLTPNQDPMLAFELLVRKAWSYSSGLGPVMQMPFAPQGLGLFTPGGELGTPIVAVTLTRCPFDVAIDAWLRWGLQREGWRIVKAHWVSGAQGLFYDATAHRFTQSGLELIRRSSVRSDQGRILSVNCSCARAHWDDVKEDFWAAHVTFALVRGTHEPSSEAWRSWSSVQPDFEVSCPATWIAERAKPRSADMSGLHLRLLDPTGENLLAYIFVQAERSDPNAQRSTLDLIAQACTTMQRAGVELRANPLPVDQGLDERAAAVSGWLGGCVGEAKLGTSEVDVQFDFVQSRHVVFTATLCSPRPSDDLWAALRARRAYEIVRATMHAIEP